MLMVVLVAVPWVTKSFVSVPGVLCFLKAPIKQHLITNLLDNLLDGMWAKIKSQT